jgi:DNA-binding GntR family transcriptional regulator
VLLRDNIYDALRFDILACRLAPGTEIWEQDLAAQYGVSRQPVREALLRLERERLVTIRPRQGYQINPISVADARDLFGFRLVLEPACAALAAETSPTATLADLDRFRTLEPGADFIAYNRDFHVAMAQASGNRRMAAVACDLIEQADRLVRVSLADIRGRDPSQLVAEHAAIIDALQARDGRRAKRIIRDHVSSAQKRVLSALSRSAIVT